MNLILNLVVTIGVMELDNFVVYKRENKKNHATAPLLVKFI